MESVETEQGCFSLLTISIDVGIGERGKVHKGVGLILESILDEKTLDGGLGLGFQHLETLFLIPTSSIKSRQERERDSLPSTYLPRS